MDDASKENMLMLDAIAQKGVADDSQRIDRVCRELTRRRSMAKAFKSYGSGKTQLA